MSAWIWLIIAVALVIFEVVTVDFIFLMLAGGALVTALVALFSPSLLVQALAFAAVSLVLLFGVRPLLKRRLFAGSQIRTNVHALEGKTALVQQDLSAHNGQVLLNGETWSARLHIPEVSAGSHPLKTIGPGAEVQVVRIDGATAVVTPLNNGAKDNLGK